jgi:hypothetical protein
MTRISSRARSVEFQWRFTVLRWTIFPGCRPVDPAEDITGSSTGAR